MVVMVGGFFLVGISNGWLAHVRDSAGLNAKIGLGPLAFCVEVPVLASGGGRKRMARIGRERDRILASWHLIGCTTPWCPSKKHERQGGPTATRIHVVPEATMRFGRENYKKAALPSHQFVLRSRVRKSRPAVVPCLRPDFLSPHTPLISSPILHLFPQRLQPRRLLSSILTFSATFSLSKDHPALCGRISHLDSED